MVHNVLKCLAHSFMLMSNLHHDVNEDTQAAPRLRDRERHRRISRNTVPSLRDVMRQSIGGPGLMGDQVKEDESGAGGLIPCELLPDNIRRLKGQTGSPTIDLTPSSAHEGVR